MNADWVLVAPVASVVTSGLLAVILFWRRRASPFHRLVAYVLLATGLVQIGNGLGLVDVAHALAWRRLAVLGELWQAVAILFLGATHLGSAAAEPDKSARTRARVVALVGVVLACLVGAKGMLVTATSDAGGSFLALGPIGRANYVFLLLALALGIAQLESIVRALREPFRYQLKYVLIGLGGLAGYGVYQASHLLLIPVWQDEYVLVGSLVSLLSVAVVAFGLGRYRLHEATVRVTVSPQMLYGSITVLVLGLYLLAVGLVAQLIRMSGRPWSIGVSTVVVFIAALGLVIALLSRAVRAELRKFVARHFYRSKYDYRAKWLEVTDAFRGADSAESILDKLLDLSSRTFGAGRISIWMPVAADGCFHRVRSANTEPTPRPLRRGHAVVARLARTDEPVLTSELGLSGEDAEFLESTRAVLCVPIRLDDALIGFMALSRELQGTYGTDDCDLLRAIARHVGVLLSHARLAEERRAAAELEALHRFSAFCVHDLKNLASRLSLVAQNAETHGDDPGFRASAMKTVAGTVRKMTELISRLSVGAHHLAAPELVDVREVIRDTLTMVNGSPGVTIESTGNPVPRVLIGREELQQILLNLIFNARQATELLRPDSMEGRGAVRIHTELQNESVVIVVSDHGGGISPEGLRTLFEPFQTTKAGGLGIGLYQCKRILEARQGTIRIESEPGHGTTVRIELPRGTSQDERNVATQNVGAEPQEVRD